MSSHCFKNFHPSCQEGMGQLGPLFQGHVVEAATSWWARTPTARYKQGSGYNAEGLSQGICHCHVGPN